MVIAAVNENINVTKCLGKENCQNGSACLTHSLWEDLSNRIEAFLNEITLAELVDKQRQKPTRKVHQDFENLLVVNG